MIRRTRVLFPLALAACLGAAPLLAEDLDPAALFDSAKTAYGEKKYGKALQDLKLLANEIGRLRLATIEATLPAAPAGWTAKESEVDASGLGLAMLGGGLQVRREYAKGDDVRVTVEVLADSPFIAGISMWLQNPQFLPPGSQVVTVKGRRAVVQYDKENRSGEVSLLLNANTTLLKVSGEGVAKEDLATTFANALDLDKIEQALQN